MPKKYSPTFEEYEEMGERLKVLRAEMMKCGIYISHKIGTTRLERECNLLTM